MSGPTDQEREAFEALWEGILTSEELQECDEKWAEMQAAESEADYIRTEAERLPNGTAARFLAALDAMDGVTEQALEGGES